MIMLLLMTVPSIRHSVWRWDVGELVQMSFLSFKLHLFTTLFCIILYRYDGVLRESLTVSSSCQVYHFLQTASDILTKCLTFWPFEYIVVMMRPQTFFSGSGRDRKEDWRSSGGFVELQGVMTAGLNQEAKETVPFGFYLLDLFYLCFFFGRKWPYEYVMFVFLSFFSSSCLCSTLLWGGVGLVKYQMQNITKDEI